MYQYPYGDTQQLNLDWIINKLIELANEQESDVTLEQVSNALISLTYIPTQAYNNSDIVFHDGHLYRCNTTIPAPGEVWDPSHWDQIMLGNTVANLVRAVAGMNSDHVFNESDVSGLHVTEALNNLKDAIEQQVSKTFTSIGFFNRIGVIGDSFASGAIFVSGTQYINYDCSWIQILAHKYGKTGVNYSASGMSTRKFRNPADSNYNTYGYGKLIADIGTKNAPGLYIIALGINDINDSIPIGTISDINDNDPTQNADTFYGNYGFIIQQIRANKSIARIMCSTVTRPGGDVTTYNNYNNAIIAIANKFGVPLLDIRNDEFFNSEYWENYMSSGHPTATRYAGMANAYERIIAKALIDNPLYCNSYRNQDTYTDKEYHAGDIIHTTGEYMHPMPGFWGNAKTLRFNVTLDKPIGASVTNVVISGNIIAHLDTGTNRNKTIPVTDLSGYTFSISSYGLGFQCTFAQDQTDIVSGMNSLIQLNGITITLS